MGDTYTHGHHASVLRSHTWRTADNSSGYLLGTLRPGHDLLDVGCGPGTITAGLAARVAPGRVVGIDASLEVLVQATEHRDSLATSSPVTNVSFTAGDVYRLAFEDASFDIIHAHQVLQHLTDPLAALAEMRRVLRPGGVLAVRDSDFGGFTWAPADPLLDRWLELYYEVTVHNHTQADAGRHLLGWVQAAGFTEVRATSSTWTFAEPESRSWWGDLWADRVQLSSFADQALSYGFSDAAELATIAGAWRNWADQEDGCFVVLHGEVLARR